MLHATILGEVYTSSGNSARKLYLLNVYLAGKLTAVMKVCGKAHLTFSLLQDLQVVFYARRE